MTTIQITYDHDDMLLSLVCVHSAQHHHIASSVSTYLKKKEYHFTFILPTSMNQMSALIWWSSLFSYYCYHIYLHLHPKKIMCMQQTKQLKSHTTTTINFYYGSTTHKIGWLRTLLFWSLLVVSLNCTYGSTGLVIWFGRLNVESTLLHLTFDPINNAKWINYEKKTELTLFPFNLSPYIQHSSSCRHFKLCPCTFCV